MLLATMIIEVLPTATLKILPMTTLVVLPMTMSIVLLISRLMVTHDEAKDAGHITKLAIIKARKKNTKSFLKPN